MKGKIIIIGAGFGGLSLAIRLQARGFKVSVFEKNALVGGHAYPLEKDGYKFDMGPSLITAPDIINDIFQSANEQLSDYLELIKLEPFYRIYFHDKSFIDYTDNSELMKTQMRRYNAKDATNYDKFINASKKIYDVVITGGLGATPFMNWGTMLKFIPYALRLNALLPTYSFAKHYFKDFRHRFTFSFHPLFIGGNPFRAPSVYQMIPYLEKEGGVWFSKGGMYSLVKSFEKVFLKLGGEIKPNKPVKEIVLNNTRAVGVKVGDDFYPADAVVSNADFIHTYKDLIKPEYRQKWTDKKLKKTDYSMSAFLLYLGVKKRYHELKHHTLILSKRYKSLIKDIFDKKILPDDFSMYLHVPSKTDPQMAPDGCESMYVLIPVANLAGRVDWEKEGTLFKDKVLAFLEDDFGLTDLRKNLQVCEMFTPLDFEKKQNAYLGSAWGVEPKLTQTAIFRPHNRCSDIEGLYLVGASTHPGAGLPGVMLTARTTENVILNDFKKSRINFSAMGVK
ncbi:phytoene desaturase [candidate division KSB1 bacterium]|nr:phytoene desaturase [candidate division KSB1 bacterium]